MIAYIDTSAVIKLLADEPGSGPMAELIANWSDDDHLVGSTLLFTEVMCAAQRRGLDERYASALMQALILHDVLKPDFLTAGQAQWRLRGADALHLAVALRTKATTLITYDRELAEVAQRLGLDVLSPGAGD